MSDAEQKAPGCFGSPSVYSGDSRFCQSCVAFAECEPKALLALKELVPLLDVRDIIDRHRAAKVKVAGRLAPPKRSNIETTPIPVAKTAPLAPILRTTTKEKIVFTMSEQDRLIVTAIHNRNTKAGEAALSLCKRNAIRDAITALRQGRNYFIDNGGSNWMRVAVDLLLQKGCFTRTELRTKLMQELGWQEGSASSHTSVTVMILLGFQVAVEIDKTLHLNPALKVNHVV